MPWLTPADDEVACFHSAFQDAAEESLRLAGLDNELEWKHHLRRPGSTIVPDFVLRKKNTRRWVLAMELKRTREAVFSTRFQIQAKAYAEVNQHEFTAGAPKYFAISNLEVTEVFALNENRPPQECRITGGLFESGEFVPGSAAVHKASFVQHLVEITNIVNTNRRPQFDMVWPGVIADWLNYTGVIPDSPSIRIPEPTTRNWPLVRDYFAASVREDAQRILLLRCLMAEYLRGILLRSEHAYAERLPAIQPDLAGIATAIAALRQIDFEAVFEDYAPDLYRHIGERTVREPLEEYVTRIVRPDGRVVDLAKTRTDAPELLESLFASVYPLPTQDEFGKVQTDPELASILAWLSINDAVCSVIDPCCGDGALLSAAYDRLRSLTASHDNALQNIFGIEADALGVRLAAIRLALKEPAALTPHAAINVQRGDLFSLQQVVSRASVILMNPPFKRYEEQDLRPVPHELRQHFIDAIRQIDGVPAVTAAGQANLFNLYVEFIGKSANSGTVLAIILDNRWYHNSYGKALRKFLLENFEIEGIIEYPHDAFFSKLTIATSIIIARKVSPASADHTVRFTRSKVDPRGVDLQELFDAFWNNGRWPTDWTCNEVPQAQLDPAVGWKAFFSENLMNDYRSLGWPGFDDLFAYSRRGSLQKEGGGIDVFEFPFNRTSFGFRRKSKGAGRSPFQTSKERALTATENAKLSQLANAIPADYKGWALKNADDIDGYEISIQAVTKNETIEPPVLRNNYGLFRHSGRTEWTAHHDQALRDMLRQPRVAAYIAEVEKVINLKEGVLTKQEIWNGLREPIAGEIIIPRKTRSGHRLHINPFALSGHTRQIRISSNFITYGNCTALDQQSGLDRTLAVKLIVAFLVSSFGQLQYEIEGYNREGLLAMEKDQLSRVRIFDPRWIRAANRQRILDAFANLPYPIATDRLSAEQPERNALDELLAAEIAARHPQIDPVELVTEVHTFLDEWLIARQP